MADDEHRQPHNGVPVRRIMLVWVPTAIAAISFVFTAFGFIRVPFDYAELDRQATAVEHRSKAMACRTAAYEHVLMDDKEKAQESLDCIHRSLIEAMKLGDPQSLETLHDIYMDQTIGDAARNLTSRKTIEFAKSAWCGMRNQAIMEDQSAPPFGSVDCPIQPSK